MKTVQLGQVCLKGTTPRIRLQADKRPILGEMTVRFKMDGAKQRVLGFREEFHITK